MDPATSAAPYGGEILSGRGAEAHCSAHSDPSYSSSPSSVDFLLFAPIFSLFSAAYLELAPRLAPRASSPAASMAVEVTNTVFYFGGFIALAIFLSRLRFCTGALCAVARATSVVAAAEFASWIATAILLAKLLFRGGPEHGNGVHSVQPLGTQMRQKQMQEEREAGMRRTQEQEQQRDV
ncbi:Membrane-associating domain [Geosmithia morbida]|uniref:Membrane-associating domain n=1 Tax=Geosmithia morbida TaxID=1094350 RepID=A0A9P4YXR1_9HYPO|nr:Membrane-associating domain [Geosmithia morbida]KAF4123729.1 Membrane-associating domain [Geosmithia morbida]